MTIDVTIPLSELAVADLVADGYTTLTLWYANGPSGAYANTAAVPTPTTLAAMQVAPGTWTATFSYAAGNAAQWFKVRAFNGATYSDLPESSPFHGGGGTTLAALRQKLGREIRDMRIAVATTGTTGTSLVTATPDVYRFQSSFFDGWLANNPTRLLWSPVTVSTKGAGTTTITLDPAITGQVTTDSVELTRRFTPEEYRDAINWAIQASWPILVKNIVSTDIYTANQVHQYDVPHDIKNVHSVELESWANNNSTSSTVRGFPWTPVPFLVVRDGLRQKIEFAQWYTPDLRLRVIGTGPLSQLYNDSDYVEEIEPQTDLIVYAAAFHLYRGLPNDAASTDIDRYAQLAEHYWKLQLSLRGSYAQGRPAKQGWSAEARGSRLGSGAMGSFNGSNY